MKMFSTISLDADVSTDVTARYHIFNISGGGLGAWVRTTLGVCRDVSIVTNSQRKIFSGLMAYTIFVLRTAHNNAIFTALSISLLMVTSVQI